MAGSAAVFRRTSANRGTAGAPFCGIVQLPNRIPAVKEFVLKLHVAIVDDSAPDRDRLSADIRSWASSGNGTDVSLSVFPGAEELIAALPDMPPLQLVFLDIMMGGMNGIELAQHLRRRDAGLLIVFLTSSREYAFDAFPLHPFDYLIKPYAAAAVRSVLDEALRSLSAARPEITVRVSRGELRLPVDRLVSAVSHAHAVDLRTVDGQTVRSTMTFAEIEALLADERFLLVNRGVLVNMDHARSLDGDVLKMDDGASYPLRTRGRADLTGRFLQYQILRMKRGGA